MRTTRTRLITATAAAALLAFLSACSGTDVGAMSADSDAAGGRVEQAAPESGREAIGGDQSKVTSTVFRVRSVIRTGDVSVTTKNLDAARADLDSLLVAVGGTIENEQTTNGTKGDPRRSTLVLRVPVDEFSTTMQGLKELGTVKDSNTASRDVTTEVIDVDERVQTLENSLNRLQAFQRKADNIDDLIRFEQQITQREAELQSMKAQQAYLADQTSMSTITLRLTTPKAFVEPPSPLDEAGFLAGLTSGWNALKSAAIVVLTVVGAVIPFTVVLVLVGVPTWLLVRRTVRSRPAASSTPAPATPADGTPPA